MSDDIVLGVFCVVGAFTTLWLIFYSACWFVVKVIDLYYWISREDWIVPDYVTLDSGQRAEFETGARRDIQTGKGRFDLLPYEPLLRLAQLYERGAVKYGENNWQKGMPLSRFLSSGLRHFFQMKSGQVDEDHAAAVLFNVAGFMWTKQKIEEGKLPSSLHDVKDIEWDETLAHIEGIKNGD